MMSAVLRLWGLRYKVLRFNVSSMDFIPENGGVAKCGILACKRPSFALPFAVFCIVKHGILKPYGSHWLERLYGIGHYDRIAL